MNKEMTMKAKFALFTLLGALAAVGSIALVARAEGPAPTILLPDTIKWGDAPPSLPPGAKLAVMAGDPGKPAVFVIRLKFPANYKIPAHWHPTDEYISVVSGSFMVGLGDTFDASKTTALPPGAFINAPANMKHFAMTKQETVVQITSMGPFQMPYVNPADAPPAK
jgi:quercetin dioxygenase-like cupin family protein